MRKECLIVFCAVLVFAFVLFSGCASGAKVACNKTTECAPDEVCSGGFCERPSAPTCRSEGQTCDVSSDCCDGMGCKGNKCTLMQCTENCDDGKPCTADSCDTSTGQCVHSTIPSCCGNGICESGESCASCTNDCGCASGEVCADNACINEIENELNRIEGNATIETCRQKVLNEWKLKNYDGVMVDAESCAGQMSEAEGELETLRNMGGINQSQKDEIAAASLTMGSKQEEMYALRFLAETYKKRETMSENAYDNLAYLQDLKTALSHLENSIYKLYQLKTTLPQEWRNQTHGALFLSYAEQYRGVNQQINSLYDDIGDYDYKYAFQVDPNDPLVIEISDRITGENSTEEVPQALLEFVYYSVEYVADPDWQTDWVQPPAYTMMAGTGDCDDKSVLLASLFKRAGVEGTHLCFVDTGDADSESDHLTVAIKYTGGTYDMYESTWAPEDYLPYSEDNQTVPFPVARKDYPGTITSCFYPEDVVSYALADKCEDGTKYGQCSLEKPMFCTEEGELIDDCERCGCDSEYPNCAKTGEFKGTCRVCLKSSDVWIDKYAVCCPRGYEDYDPVEDTCWES